LECRTRYATGRWYSITMPLAGRLC